MSGLMSSGPAQRIRQMPPHRTAAVVLIACLIAVAGLSLWFYLAAPKENHGPSGPSLSAYFEANGSGGYSTATGNITNVSIQVVNLTVPLSELVIGVEPHLDGAIVPNANWSIMVFPNSTSSTPVAQYHLDGGGPLWNTSDSGNITVGMVFSIFTPSGIYMPGGFMAFSAPDGTSEIGWFA
jgi:hypothetical protein